MARIRQDDVDAVRERMGILNAYHFPDKDYDALYPTITPDGRHLAYALETSDHSYDVYHASMTNLADATLIARDRTNPVFLNNRQLWYQTVGGGCGGTETPKPRVYDIRTGGEASSILVSVDTIWPGTSSNH